MSIRPAAAAALLKDVESQLRAEGGWVLGEVDYWPLVRTQLGHELRHSGIGVRWTAPEVRGLRSIKGWVANTQTLFGSDLIPLEARADVWIVSNGYTRASGLGQDHDRICDPIAAAARRVDLRPLQFDRSGIPRRGFAGAHSSAGETLVVKAASAMAGRLGAGRPYSEMALRVNEALHQRGVSSVRLSTRRMAASALGLNWLSRRYEHRLRTSKPRLVLLATYFDVAGMALCLAANRCGIRAVDVQHGVIDRYHQAYGDHPLPDSGRFKLLPWGFWCWRDADREIVQEWSRGRHRVLTGGNPLVSGWIEGLVPESAAADRQAESFRPPGGQVVLVTLGPGLAREDSLGALIDFAIDAPDIEWWFRLHPRGMDDGPLLENLLRGRGLRSFRIRGPSRIPLISLLRACDAHATHSSSSMLEASAMGLRSLVFSEYGAEHFSHLVESGDALVATDVDDIRELLPQLLTEARGVRSVEDQPPMGRVLLQLLE